MLNRPFWNGLFARPVVMLRRRYLLKPIYSIISLLIVCVLDLVYGAEWRKLCSSYLIYLQWWFSQWWFHSACFFIIWNWLCFITVHVCGLLYILYIWMIYWTAVIFEYIACLYFRIQEFLNIKMVRQRFWTRFGPVANHCHSLSEDVEEGTLPCPPHCQVQSAGHLIIQFVFILKVSHVQIALTSALHFRGPKRMHMPSVKLIW